MSSRLGLGMVPVSFGVSPNSGAVETGGCFFCLAILGIALGTCTTTLGGAGRKSKGECPSSGDGIGSVGAS